jgi:FAD synthetase
MLFSKKIKKSPSEKLVMAFGTFDFLHAGHENFLKQAKQLGDKLLVVVALDNTVKSVKGRPPVNSEKIRLNALKKNSSVDKAILGLPGDKHKVILQYKPDIIALGYDQFVFTQTLEKTIISNQLSTEIVRLEAYFPQIYKSSLIRRQLESTQKSPAELAAQINQE